MKLLAVDTSTEACSAALYVDGEVCTRHAVAPRGHGQLLLGMMEDLLREANCTLADLDALAYGRGPGAFTGVRIAAGVVQGVAFGARLPVVPVSSLAALAQGAYAERGEGRVLAAIDARMGEVYWGAFTLDAHGLMEAAGREWVCAPDDVYVPDGGDWFGTGSGWSAYTNALGAAVGARLRGWEAERYPHARDVAVLGAAGLSAGRSVAASDAMPVYLRDRVVQHPAAG